MLGIQKAPDFIGDFDIQFRWYAFEADWNVAMRYLSAVHQTLELLAYQPALGRERRFRDPRLRGLRSFRTQQPFNKHLIFYRYDATTLFAERIAHGARNLPRRLLQRPGTD
ncbi:MAG TPA: type II toxin-antitoxin system RelE/ParE family toxin [Methylomirabilota bacterium]|nr:type II toxin-antitoxin system RelE/ParE family toxin [Methylomirabilota bacterium]